MSRTRWGMQRSQIAEISQMNQAVSHASHTHKTRALVSPTCLVQEGRECACKVLWSREAVLRGELQLRVSRVTRQRRTPGCQTMAAAELSRRRSPQGTVPAPAAGPLASARRLMPQGVGQQAKVGAYSSIFAVNGDQNLK